MIHGLITLLLLAAPSAQAAEYRAITLSNGRSIPAEVKDMTATEIVLSTPQGVVRIPSAELQSMEPLTAEAYAAIEPWAVVVLPFATNDNAVKDDAEMANMLARRVLSSIPNIVPTTIQELPESVGQSARRSLALCGTDLQCAVRHGQVAEADVVVMGRVDSNGEHRTLTLGAVFIDAPAARSRITIEYTGPIVARRSEIAKSQYSVLFLDPPTNALPPIVESAPPEPPPKKSDSDYEMAKLVWAPVPGITALKQDDNAGFATAVGLVGAGTAASVYMAGRATYSAPQMVAMTALTSYSLTVLVNNIFVKK
jgi:hypothetical protein